MQTISVPYVVADDDNETIARWQRLHACVVRTGYARAAQADGTLLPEKDLRNLLKSLFPNHPLGSWGIHCATREALRLRKQRPDGRIVFGGRKELERRLKGLITNEEWRQRRHSRPIEIVGDRSYWGNRHFRLSADALRCEVDFLGQKVTLHLPEMAGAQGFLMRTVALLASAGEIPVQFGLGRNELTVCFDPHDLRKLPPGMTLEQVERTEREARGQKPRGRPRKDADRHTREHRFKPIPAEARPVHPEWRPTIPTMTTRAVGIDLNPEWIGLTVVEIPVGTDPRNADAIRILDHRLIKLDVPIDATPEAQATHMARAARMATSLARKWHAATVFHENGLGKLRWSKKSRGAPINQTINHWSRNVLLGGLARRCTLSGIRISPIWGGYSTTVGNMLFDLPDACAAAAEIARRGLASLRGEKDRLPAVPQTVHLRRWKDGEVPENVAEAVSKAGSWSEVHRAIKAAKTIGYRRLHPAMDPGRLPHGSGGYAVSAVGSRKSGRLTVATPVSRHPA